MNPTPMATVQEIYNAHESHDLALHIRKRGNAVTALKSSTPRFTNSGASPTGPATYSPERVRSADFGCMELQELICMLLFSITEPFQHCSRRQPQERPSVRSSTKNRALKRRSPSSQQTVQGNRMARSSQAARNYRRHDRLWLVQRLRLYDHFLPNSRRGICRRTRMKALARSIVLD